MAALLALAGFATRICYKPAQRIPIVTVPPRRHAHPPHIQVSKAPCQIAGPLRTPHVHPSTYLTTLGFTRWMHVDVVLKPARGVASQACHSLKPEVQA